MRTNPSPNRSGYVIRTRGHLSPALGDRLGGLDYENLSSGDALLYLPCSDQAALYGLLLRLRDAGITLLSVVLSSCAVDENLV